MDLSQPGADLLGVAETRVLRALARLNQPVSGREVARLAEVNATSTRRALNRLQHTGLVDAVAVKPALQFSINREHVLWAPVLAMLTATVRVRQEIAALAERRLRDRVTAAVFGSVARGDSSSESDVDVVLIFADDVAPEEREALIDALSAMVERMTGNPAQILSVSRSQLQEMAEQDDPLVASWRRDAQTLSGPSLTTLLAA